MYTVRLIHLLQRLPPYPLELVLASLPQKYFTRWLLHLPNSSTLRRVAEYIFTNNMLMLLNPHGYLDFPWNARSVNALRGPAACEKFIRNIGIRPRRVTVAVRNFSDLDSLLEVYSWWFRSLDEVVLFIHCDLTDAICHKLEVFRSNLVEIRLEYLNYYCSEYFRAHGWTRFPKLKSLTSDVHSTLDEELVYLSGRFIKPGNHGIDLWWDYSEVHLLVLPPHLTELCVHGCNSPMVCPPSVKTLRLTKNTIPTLELDKLPLSLTTLVFCENHTTRISGCAFPELLETLHLFEPIDPTDLIRISSHGWPPGLRHLTISLRMRQCFDCIFNLPQCLETLKIDGFKVFGSPFDSLPRLVKLTIEYLRVLWEDIRFPPTLQHLSITNCKLTALDMFEFPTLIKTLDLRFNEIVDLDTYSGWHRLVNLVELDSSSNWCELSPWHPPPSIKVYNGKRIQST